MKLLLIHPPWQRFFGQGINTPPMALNCIASYLSKEIPQAVIEIYNADQIGKKRNIFTSYDYATKHDIYVNKLKDISNPVWLEVASVIKQFSPDVVGISSMTANYYSALMVAKITKNISDDITVIMGGKHPSALPEDVLENKEIDYVIVGEGEIPLKQFLLNLTKYSEINGLVYRENGSIHKNKPIYLEDLDVLPIPYFKSNINRYDFEENNNSAVTWNLIGARGCPFSCVYCASDKNIRYRSPHHIIEEIKHIKNRFHLNYFAFLDDSFSLNKKRAFELCDLLAPEKVNWRCSTRVDIIDEKLIKKMKESGCYEIAIGIETGSPRTMKLINKNISYPEIVTAVNLFKKYNILTTGYFIIGFPWEDEKDMYDTLSLIESLSLDDFEVNIATPLPGTKLFNDLVLNGKIDLKNIDWTIFQQGSLYMNYSDFDDLSWKKILLNITKKSKRIHQKKLLIKTVKMFFKDPFATIKKVSRYIE